MLENTSTYLGSIILKEVIHFSWNIRHEQQKFIHVF